MNPDFHSGEALLTLCKEKSCPISTIMREREAAFSGRSMEDIDAEMAENLKTMKDSVRKGLFEPKESVSGLSGGDAERLMHHAENSLMGADMAMLVASSMAVVEVNAAMGRIVAAPTAGASGILPGTLLSCAKKQGWNDEMLLDALFTAGAVGMLIARNASISGAEGGCQAETGAGAAMTAAALAALSGGTPEVVLTAAAIALKNVMGLVCDPVAGLVECPCIKRNAIGAANAVLSADLALAGIKSLIPFDEVVSAMKHVGRMMNTDLKETARGGIAASPTGKAIRRQLGLNEE
ncbi:MAG: L-serine ammonia-lyase, iron-sulfur-dependent, subunit alpha [Clostridiales bacterium]|nr:L-serine ammonia-lyase, iron-sulfur-dependent, subunit alpha [Clostridiales bacterium]